MRAEAIEEIYRHLDMHRYVAERDDIWPHVGDVLKEMAERIVELEKKAEKEE